jgi:acyl-CoA reductase-like NAD-dependent aldehyde dehydrogenase
MVSPHGKKRGSRNGGVRKVGARLEVRKTYKLFVGGEFVRSESGRFLTTAEGDQVNVCRGSRKDLKAAVIAARNGFNGWAKKTAYNRGQILYRAAEMLERRRAEFLDELLRGTKPTATARSRAANEVAAAIDRLVWYAGWCDKFLGVLGSMNPVSGPFFNFSTAEPTGVIGVLAPNDQPLLGLVSMVAPLLCSGNAVIALVSEPNPLPGLCLGEVFATSDWPKGTVNLLSGLREELLPALADHMAIDGIFAAGLDCAQQKLVQERGAENLKRMRFVPSSEVDQQSPLWIEPFVEVKTIWHPIGV